MGEPARPMVLMPYTPAEFARLVREAVRAELASTSNEEREIMTCQQAAELVGLHPYTLAKLAKRDGLGVRIGGTNRWRFRRAEVLEWAAKRKD